MAGGTEADGYIFLRLVQMEAGLPDFFGDPGHVGHAPGNDEDVRFGKSRIQFIRQVPVALVDEVVKELSLQIGRGRVLNEFQDGFRVHALGVDEHDQIEAINGVGSELFDIHIRADHFAPAGLEFLLLLGQTEGGGHSLVADMVREQVPVVRHSFHENDRICRERG